MHDVLNARFRDGTATNDLTAAGVLLRQFDRTEDIERPWRGCPGGHVSNGAGHDCELFGNRLSASIVNAQMVSPRDKVVPVFSTEGGVVYSPTLSGITCIFGGDGGSRKFSDGCGHDYCPPQRSAAGDVWCDGKPHFRTHIGDVLRGFSTVRQGSFNEVILNSETLDTHLPKVVEAFFYVTPTGATAARAAHEKFVAKYGLKPTHPDFVPLLRLDVSDPDHPFKPSGFRGGTQLAG